MAANAHPESGSSASAERATGSELPAQLGEWMRRQRWYTSKGATPRLERRGGWSLDSGDASIETVYVLDRQSRGATLYQVPLSRRSTPLVGIEAIWRDESGYVYDAPHDPEYARAVLRMLDSETVAGDANGHRQPGARSVTIDTSAVLTGEQSNTSIVCVSGDGRSVILKVFRALHSGDNPDVIVQSAISAAGSSLVPAPLGYLTGEWPDRTESDGRARGHLAFAQDFLSGAEDGWRIALRAADAAEDFAQRARQLGRATAELHSTLAEVFPATATTGEDVARFVAAMRLRADSALAEVPALEPVRARIASTIDALLGLDWPRLQRIHGDYHLGQVLSVPPTFNAWVIIDFEGEPLRPMNERSVEDVALRDVAGMVRSFDYVAGAVAHRAGRATDDRADAWAQSARLAFLSGYAEGGTGDLLEYPSLLDALELDKALYEAVYEARNRPDWLGIPVAAIQRLIGK
ncbi:MAG TPA: phosphotransferase [Galbitalea sp.]|jgi:trehalose synthase-fused probable maltokinase|nr:phosphotransferase [Galbitalea sp.]